jgi:ribosomal-protein-alanine N-acetyltransferase
MSHIESQRLRLTPFAIVDFDRFVRDMLTDSRVVEFYYSYRDMVDTDEIRDKALADFWEEFEESRAAHGLQIWAAYDKETKAALVGWCGLLHGELSDQYGGPEMQYMIAGDFHGKGLATEFARAVLRHAAEEKITRSVIATVDIPNRGSIRVLEKLGFDREGQIHAYGSDDMYLYRKALFC